MEDKQAVTEQELTEMAKRMLSNGHRFSYVYKRLRDKTEDSDMISRVVDKAKADLQVHAAREEQMKKMEGGSNRWVPIGMGVLLIIFGAVINYTLTASGFIGTLPYILMGAGLIIAIGGVVK